MKKKWWIIGFATLAIAGGLAVAIPMLQPPRPDVTKANFDRIEDGMTEQDIEAISGPSRGIWKAFQDPSCRQQSDCWERDDGAAAYVDFFDGRVSYKRWTESTETITDKLRRWLS